MLRLVILLTAVSVVSATQKCYSCTSAQSYDELLSWQWSPYLNNGQNYYQLKMSSQCDLEPILAGGDIDCNSLCFKWQFNYTDTSGRPAYKTVRGCAVEQLRQYPSSEDCPDPQATTNGYIGAPGGPQHGYSEMCFCSGDFCNPAAKTTAYSIGALILLAFFTFMFH
uniref:Protein sleepless n=1 Tax=Plectus sambesii TaxID=2011161 RepID=A0A914VXI3_9BILA